MKQLDAMQLQFWDSRARAYVPASSCETERGAIERLADIGRAMYKAWRICKADRPLKPTRYVPPRGSATGRTVDDVQRDYLTWAQSRGLQSIHVYDRRPPVNWSPKTEYRNSRGERFTIPRCDRLFYGVMVPISFDAQMAVTHTFDAPVCERSSAVAYA